MWSLSLLLIGFRPFNFWLFLFVGVPGIFFPAPVVELSYTHPAGSSSVAGSPDSVTKSVRTKVSSHIKSSIRSESSSVTVITGMGLLTPARSPSEPEGPTAPSHSSSSASVISPAETPTISVVRIEDSLLSFSQQAPDFFVVLIFPFCDLIFELIDFFSDFVDFFIGGVFLKMELVQFYILSSEF